jgi:tRNA pseudouridine38-40 synthase
MSRFRFTVAYDGTAYAGWQIQPGQATIQQVLEDALHGLTGETVKVHGSGRTDAGVHAAGQVIHVDTALTLPPVAFVRALNVRLPRDIRILGGAGVPDDFHARKSAISKEYRYFIYQGEILLPHLRLYRAHVHRPLDLDAMRIALSMLEGTHDFAAFSANPDREVETTVRTIFDAGLHADGPEVMISLRGDGFLYKMVRSIAGWLIRVGRGDVSAQETELVLASRIRTAAVPTAPAEGLFLWLVEYRGKSCVAV